MRKEEKLDDVDRKSRDKKSPILGEHVSQDIEKFSEEWQSLETLLRKIKHIPAKLNMQSPKNQI